MAKELDTTTRRTFLIEVRRLISLAINTVPQGKDNDSRIRSPSPEMNQFVLGR